MKVGLDKRSFMGLLAAGVASSCAPLRMGASKGDIDLYGLIGKMTATPGQRDALAEILLAGLAAMPGNLSYIVAKDPADPDTLWITEVWSDKESHAASLSLPSVRDAIAKGRPLISGMEQVAETTPIGGNGI